MPASAFFIGKGIQVLYSMLLQVVLLLGFGALFFRLELPTDASRWIAFFWIMGLGSVSAAILGIAFSSVPKSGRAASAVVSPIVIVLQFFSGVFFVFSELPGWMQQFAALFPLKWLTQGMRYVLLPDSFATQEVAGSYGIGRIALVLLLWTIIGTFLAVKTFRWSKK